MRLVWYRGSWAAYDPKTKRRTALRTTDRALAEQLLADLIKNTAHKVETVSEAMAAYLDEKDTTTAAPERLREAWIPLKPHFGNLRPDQVTRKLCREYHEERKAGPGTINKELRTLRAGLNWHDKNNGAQFEFLPNPPPRDRRLTLPEYRKLRDAAKMRHVRAFIILALATAARKGALLDLTWDRVDFEGGIITLSTGEGGRKGRATIPMTKAARECLEELKNAALTDYVIEWAGKPVQSIKKGFAAACKRSGVECTPHVLRHTAACWMAEAGTPMSEIAQVLGHTDSRITERVYAKYSPDYLRGAISALET